MQEIEMFQVIGNEANRLFADLNTPWQLQGPRECRSPTH